jgi:predicted SnoaL-like aldol condensation-catalyzing enzyme
MKILITSLLLIVSIPVFAAFPVLPVPAEEQAKLLESNSPELAANKRVAYDLYRIVMAAQVEQLEKYVSQDLINHNPNEAPGFDGLKEYIRQYLGSEPRPVKDTLDGLVSVFAEGDMVIMAFVREYDNPNKPGEKYTTTWFDMFRIVNGKMIEHWDPATIKVK